MAGKSLFEDFARQTKNSLVLPLSEAARQDHLGLAQYARLQQDQLIILLKVESLKLKRLGEGWYLHAAFHGLMTHW